MRDLARPPSPLCTLTEGWRATFELGAAFQLLFTQAAAAMLARRETEGHGRAVLVWPGCGAGDSSTFLLRRFLANEGYKTYGRDDSRTTTMSAAELSRAEKQLSIIRHRHRPQRVAVIGHSLGGLIVGELAQRQPDSISQIITLGTPHMLRQLPPGANQWLEAAHRQAAVPITSIFSFSDGIVGGACFKAGHRQTENLGIRWASHMLPTHAVVLSIIRDRLREPWQPYVIPKKYSRICHSLENRRRTRRAAVQKNIAYKYRQRRSS